MPQYRTGETSAREAGNLCYVPAMTDKPQSQLDKFKEAARQLECDDDEKRFAERVKKLVKPKPADKAE